jgi:hypothetical protein
MLPEIRQSDYLYTVPKFELERKDVSNFALELKGFHENFANCFLRSESRDNFYRCLGTIFIDIWPGSFARWSANPLSPSLSP